MKILITGGAGYIGCQLVKRLLKNPSNDITVIDSLRYNQGPLVYDLMQNVNFIQRDITYKFLNDILTAIKEADVLILLAAIVGVPACNKDLEGTINTNTIAIKRILEQINPNQLVIYPNTNSGYGSVTDGICTEETPLNPISLYGSSKDEAERLVVAHNNSVVFRLATVFGYSTRHRLDLLVNTLVYEAVTKGIINIFDDAFMRNYIHVDDVCDAFATAIYNPAKYIGQVYNLGNDSLNMTKGDLANEINKYIDCTVHKINQTDPDKRNYTVSSEKLYKTGWKPSFDLQYGIKQLELFYSYLTPQTNMDSMTNA